MKEESNTFLGKKTTRTDGELGVRKLIVLIRTFLSLPKVTNKIRNDYSRTIKTLGSSLNLEQYRDKSILQFPFLQKLTIDDFIGLLYVSALIIFETTTPKLKKKKFHFINSISSKDIKSLLDDNPLSSAKRDILLANFSSLNEALISPSIIFRANSYYDFFASEYRRTPNYMLRKKTTQLLEQYKNLFSNPTEETTEEIIKPNDKIFNRHFLKSILCSEPLLELFQKVLIFQKISATTEEIKAKLSPFIDKIEIYYCLMTEYGFTINEGIVFINEAYALAARERDCYAGAVLIIIFHEMQHCLLRLMRLDNNNYYLLADPIDDIDDYGEMLERILLGKNVFLMTDRCGAFLLNENNYKCDLKSFQGNIKDHLSYKEEKGVCNIGKSKGVPCRVICSTLAKGGYRSDECRFR